MAGFVICTPNLKLFIEIKEKEKLTCRREKHACNVDPENVLRLLTKTRSH